MLNATERVDAVAVRIHELDDSAMTESVFVLDGDMDRQRVVAAARSARSLGSDVHVVLLVEAGATCPEALSRAAGAAGWMTRATSPDALIDAVFDADVGRRVSPNCQPTQPKDPETRRAALVTPREVEVLRHLAAGQSIDAIADALAISSATVRAHLQSAMSKLGVRTRVAALGVARRAHILDRPDADTSDGG